MIRILTAAAFAFALAAPAFAQTNAPDPAISQARSDMKASCHADIQTYCGSAERGPAKHQCMVENRAKFSQSCKDAMAKMHAERQAAKAPQAPANPG